MGSATSKVRIRQEPNAVCAYASERYPQPIITRRQDTIARKYFFVMTALPKGITELRGRGTGVGGDVHEGEDYGEGYGGRGEG